ncbi:hypothetical protein MK079_04805 [Candidatus Gracilibacteria bacterium]|nr:hypothetical protein [Candidatus Gracilibacteria bacterium]
MNSNFTQYSEIEKNGERTIQVNGVDFEDTKFVDVFLGDTLDFLQGKRKCEVLGHDSHRTVYQLAGNIWVIKYEELSIRDTDRDLFKQHFKPTKYFAELEADGNQVPQADFKVDYEGKYYLAIHAHKSLIEEKNKQGSIIQGVIYNPGEYFSIQNQVQDTKGQIDDIT